MVRVEENIFSECVLLYVVRMQTKSVKRGNWLCLHGMTSRVVLKKAALFLIKISVSRNVVWPVVENGRQLLEEVRREQSHWTCERG